MKLARLVLTCSILCCAPLGHAIARDAATGTSGKDSATPSKSAGPVSSKDTRSKSNDKAGRKGVSCQRDTFFKGDDGQMHLCK